MEKKATTTVTVAKGSSSSVAKKQQKSFTRIDPSKTQYLDDRLKDNSFAGTFGNQSNYYGQRAYHDLASTRGKGFRQEKNKKKKGSYRGGRIDTGVHSFKFPDD